jgi:hypothetical protein
MANPFLEAVKGNIGQTNQTTPSSSENPFLKAVRTPPPPSFQPSQPEISPLLKNPILRGAVEYGAEVQEGVSNFLKDPLGTLYSAGKALISTPIEAIKNLGEKAAETVVSYQTPGRPLAERIAKPLETLGASAGVVFSPITAAFQAAEKLPVLKTAADIINLPFLATGKIGQFAADKFVDVLPISKQSKDILRPAFEEVGSLAGQIALGGKVMDLIAKKASPVIEKSEIDRIVNEAKQEVPKVEEQLKTIPASVPEANPEVSTPIETTAIPKEVKSEKTPQEILPTVKEVKLIPKELEPLAKEARKYKNAEEFVNIFQPKNVVDLSSREKRFGRIFGKFKDESLTPRPKEELQIVAKKYRELYGEDLPQNITKDTKITVYRGGRGEIEPGDFVTPFKSYAESYRKYPITQIRGEKQKLLTKKVKAEDLIYTGGDLREFIYSPHKIRKQYKDLYDFYNQVNKGIKEIKSEVKPEVSTIQKTEIPEGKPSKIAKSIEAKAIEDKLTKGFSDLAEYDPITIKDQAKRATDLVNSDINLAREIIRGDKPLPEGLRGTALIIAMEEYIKKAKDPDVAYELANSPLVSKTSYAAQELRLAAERIPDSATAKIQEIKKAREAKISEIEKKKTNLKRSLKEEMNKINLSKEELSWNRFLEKITC